MHAFMLTKKLYIYNLNLGSSTEQNYHNRIIM
jgi:hypothetical protein